MEDVQSVALDLVISIPHISTRYVDFGGVFNRRLRYKG